MLRKSTVARCLSPGDLGPSAYAYKTSADLGSQLGAAALALVGVPSTYALVSGHWVHVVGIN
jgi:hypothetical protein